MGKLVLARKLGETIRLGEDTVIGVERIHPHEVRLSIDAPPSVNIARSELPVLNQQEARNTMLTTATEAEKKAAKHNLDDFELPQEAPGSQFRGAAESALPMGSKPPKPHEFVYFDIETVPDYERIDSFPLPAIPEPAPETAKADMPQCPGEVVPLKVDEIAGLLTAQNPDAEWLAELHALELKTPRPRAGVKNAISAAIKAKNQAEDGQRSQIKLMSTTPEMCKIVAVGVELGRHGGRFAWCDPDNEVALIEKTWKLLERGKTIVGYNCLQFDLPVLLFRSALLGIDTPRLDLRKWGNDQVLDLYAAAIQWRHVPKGFGSLDRQCLLAGMRDNAEIEDFSGGDVLPAIERGDLDIVRQYVSLDVERLKYLHRFYRGTYWD